MNLGFLRAAKVAGLSIAAVTVILLTDLLFSVGTPPATGLPWNELVADGVGTVAERVETEDSAVRSLWPVERDGNTSAVVVVASAPGYRSRIDVAVTVAWDGSVLAQRVVAHSESAYVRRALEAGGIDALSGSTLTEDGIRSATENALSAARNYIEEQR
ncbi:MAG: FMN-binding protein [Alkalispirochaeta sp.]